ncbi:hypothetical protein MKW94_017021 [Papaver nudicaule]|uniref:F-box domain-containing protein n=1 Tax=Papaver nudicaule TaxID=74823 RepID=A0AA42ASJ3_PAPNU|nr:hypothetical protein [Papaver nudicaule]
MMIGKRDPSADVQKVRPKKKPGHVKHLPYDILLDILSRVPVESVLECKLVCKNWHSLLTRKRRYFNDMHVQSQLSQIHNGGGVTGVDIGLLCALTVVGNDDEVVLFYGGQYNEKLNTDEQYTYKTTLRKIRRIPQMRVRTPQEYLVGSCNGLICLGRYHDTVNDPIYICNPVTGEYTYLPKLNVPARSGRGTTHLARGFGYVRSTNEYKVVRIFFDGFLVTGQVQVYTLGSGCGWRNKKNIRFPWGGYDMPGIFANEVIYWLEPHSDIYAFEPQSDIYAFDLVTEEFWIVPNPPRLTNAVSTDTINNHFGLVVLGGNLCFYYQNLMAPHMEIWSLKSDKIWIKDFSIEYEMNNHITYWPILLTENGEVIFSWLDTKLYCYNSRTGSWKLLVDDVSVDGMVAIPHVNTFVSLEAIGQKPSKRIGADSVVGRDKVGGYL